MESSSQSQSQDQTTEPGANAAAQLFGLDENEGGDPVLAADSPAFDCEKPDTDGEYDNALDLPLEDTVTPLLDGLGEAGGEEPLLPLLRKVPRLPFGR